MPSLITVISSCGHWSCLLDFDELHFAVLFRHPGFERCNRYPFSHAELDQSLQGLLSFERLDRASPDLWPEQIPGVSDFASLTVSPFSLSSTPPKWLAELEKDDMDMLQEFGSLTTSQLMEKVRGLQNLAFQLGLDEAREMTRGKFLNILEKVNSGRR
ncbi:protein lin-52 homolog isoform X1 [Stylophora pistillata]|uniref:protein lin-52 homolog isoform X1 n=1 Tax=Stylophora pistillata TaxID=50429 RepID=UPI000C052949|nr:protein lin-52 homolog isoform X1 [Stylophora pistillata]